MFCFKSIFSSRFWYWSEYQTYGNFAGKFCVILLIVQILFPLIVIYSQNLRIISKKSGGNQYKLLVSFKMLYIIGFHFLQGQLNMVKKQNAKWYWVVVSWSAVWLPLYETKCIFTQFIFCLILQYTTYCLWEYFNNKHDNDTSLLTCPVAVSVIKKKSWLQVLKIAIFSLKIIVVYEFFKYLFYWNVVQYKI